MPTKAERYHAIIRGERRGIAAHFARVGLWWARLPYGMVVRLRNRSFDSGKKSIRVPVPVVCVGNLTLGGTGKTPCVEALANYYREQGLAVAILSRGYGAESGPNDEALLLEENLPDVPHLQGADRVAIAQTAIEELESELVILDDGFQHRRLARDLDVVLLDATRPIQNEYLFPRGLLREPVSGLRRAGAILFTRCDQVDVESLKQQIDWIAKRFPKIPLATTVHEPLARPGEELPSAEDWRTRPVAAFCGLGNPESFCRTLAQLGATVSEFRTFPDHHNYTRDDVNSLESWAKSLPANAMIATTQKDWVKLRIDSLGGKPLHAIRIGLKFLTGEEQFHEMLQNVLTPLPHSQGETV